MSVAVAVIAAVLAAGALGARNQTVTSRATGPSSTAAAAAKICSKVSASAVAAIVGYAVPLSSSLQVNADPKKNFGISAVTTLCTYGSQKTVAQLTKDVTLSFEVTSQALTAAEIKTELSGVNTSGASVAGLKFTVTPVGGFGATAFEFVGSDPTLHLNSDGISLIKGTQLYGSEVGAALPLVKLMALEKLAEQL